MTPHEELLKRVAWALCLAEGELPYTQTPYNGHVEYLWQHYIPSARAAIAEVMAVLNEPTLEMLEVGAGGAHGVKRAIFRAMLAASPLASAEDNHG